MSVGGRFERWLERRPVWGAAAVSLALAIAWASHRTWPGADRSLPRGSFDLAHFPTYALLGALSGLALGGGVGPRPASDPAWRRGGMAAFLWGLADEIHQHFVPGRSCSVLDLAVDGLGAFFGATALAWALERGSGTRRRRVLLVAWLAGGLYLASLDRRRFASIDGLLERLLTSL